MRISDWSSDVCSSDLAPRSAVAVAALVKRSGKEFVGEQRELYLLDDDPFEEAPYERLLADAIAGDRSLFTSAQAIEAAWTALDAVLTDHADALPYTRGGWGPKKAGTLIAGYGGWQNPQPEKPCGDAAPGRNI